MIFLVIGESFKSSILKILSESIGIKFAFNSEKERFLKNPLETFLLILYNYHTQTKKFQYKNK
jgi:hypothetical protein